MVFISNVNIPDNKGIVFSLTYIYGIGISRARKILSQSDIDSTKKTNKLNDEEIKKINKQIEQFDVESELKKKNRELFLEGVRIGRYRDLRRKKKLPANGQRTRHNARTAKKGGIAKIKRIAVTGKKKAPKS
jgi:small subunit ribosomal protein S13